MTRLITTLLGFLLLTPSTSFQRFQNYPTATGPVGIALGDFNRDGKTDMAIAVNFGGVSILFGHGNGTFSRHHDYFTGDGPSNVAAADFNHDGKLDLAVTNAGLLGNGTTLSILLGNGDGTFQPHVDYPTGVRPQQMAVADYNGDGNLDIAVPNFIDDTVGILLGNGDGTFQPHVDYPVQINPYSIATTDFNGDGHLDLVVANQYSGSLSVLLGKGDGSFAPQVIYNTGGADYVAVADLNRDGRVDIAAVTNTKLAAVLLGNGDGTFQPPVTYKVGHGPSSIAIGDINADGIPDLVTTNSFDNSVSVLVGNGDGTFQPHLDFNSGPGPQTVAIFDFNHDGLPDLAVPHGLTTVSILLNSSGQR
jgi:hypothetical protein